MILVGQILRETMASKTQSTFAAGQRVGKFRIVREIGRGGMGVVYLAEDVNLARSVAIKVLHEGSAADAGFRQRAIQEARASAALQHPHIVRVNSFDEIDGRLLIEMEYADGGSISELMISGAMTPQRVALLAHQILQALARCHREGIVHRDIKPSNILLDGDGRALLSDFGLAKVLAASQQQAMLSTASSVVFVGTPRYAPPEAWDGAEPAPAWDIYSLGMVLYESLAGRAPYDALTPLALAKQIASTPVKPLREVTSSVSLPFATLVHEMLSTEPAQRPSDAVALLDRLGGIPELRECALTSITVMPRISTASRLRRIARKARNYVKALPAQRAFAFGIGFAVIAVTLAAIALRVEMGPGAGGPLVQPAAQASTLSSALQQNVIDPATFGSHARSGGKGAPVILSIYAHEAGESLDPGWIIFPSSVSGENEVLAMSPNAIWSLIMRNRDDRTIEFNGNWAENRKEGRIFRSGTVVGEVYWIEPNRSLSASLNFQSLDDGAHWTSTVSATTSSTCTTDTEFLNQFEEQPQLQSLLFNELVRRQAEWVHRVEQHLPLIVDSKLVLAYDSSAPEKIQVDGKIDEDVWSRDFYTPTGRIGFMNGYPQIVKPDFKALYCDTGVYFAFSANLVSSPAPAFRMTLARNIAFSSASQELIELEIETNGPMKLQRLRNGREIAMDETWRAASGFDGGRASVEIFIPGDYVTPAEPLRNERWRVAAIFTLDRREKPLCFWGYPEPSTLLHGGVVAFADQGRQLPSAATSARESTTGPAH
jgi:hypothetical protein